MRNKIKVILTVIFLSAFIMLASCGKQKAAWNGTIEEENGVTAVSNPKRPMYGQDVFSLEEELSIGGKEGREEYLFSRATGVAVDEEERIYVLDYKEAHIKVFARDGGYAKTIGKKGQGPGEIGRPRSVSITSRNEIMVPDSGNRRLAFFSLEGEFIKNISAAKMDLMTTKIDSEGNIIGIVTVEEEENPRYELKKFDSNLNPLCSLASSPLPNVNSFNPFMPVLRWDITNNNQVVCGYPKTYEIKIFDKEGNPIRKIIKEYDPVEITKEDIEQVEKLPPTIKLSIPKYHSAYQWLIADDENRIFVLTRERIADGEGYYYDIFDSNGRYIAKIPLKFRPQVWKKNKLYTIEEDTEGYQLVKRYKVKWNI
jgi:hypothetical protein